MSKKWWVLGLIVAPVALALAFFARSKGVAWFLVFWVLALTWAIVFWVVILPRWQKAQPLAGKYAAPPTRTAYNKVAFWQGVGAIRLPSELGGLSARWPLARLLAYDDRVGLEPTLRLMSFIPSLSLGWAALERIETVGQRGVRLQIKDPAAALLVFALTNRDGLLDIAENVGLRWTEAPAAILGGALAEALLSDGIRQPS